MEIQMRNELTRSYTWHQYSKKIHTKLKLPRSIGFFTPQNAEERKLRLAIGTDGSIAEGNMIRFYWLVDESDGVVVDVRFQAFGQTALIAAAQAASELVAGKNYDQARRMSATLIDTHLQDKGRGESFPPETGSHINLVLSALDECAETCLDIVLPETYVAPPIEGMGQITGEGYPGWDELSQKQKIAVLEQIIANDIRPYIEMDAGGIEVLDLIADKEVIVGYKGNCTSCFSAIGATLSFIQQTLQAKASPNLIVVPDMTSMQL
jgi:NifU-like protein